MSADDPDTLAAARELEAAGIDPRHAEAIVALHRRSGGQAATNSDLAAGLAALENRVLKAAFGIVITNVTLTVALVKLLRAVPSAPVPAPRSGKAGRSADPSRCVTRSAHCRTGSGFR